MRSMRNSGIGCVRWDSRRDAPVRRWARQSVILDVMPLAEEILGLSNRWYRAAITAAEIHRIAADLNALVVSAPTLSRRNWMPFGDGDKGTSSRAKTWRTSFPYSS